MLKNNTIITLGIVAVSLICSVIGFLIKIPRPLQGHDKLLHFSFFIAHVFSLIYLLKIA
jgi:hypothetical protein